MKFVYFLKTKGELNKIFFTWPRGDLKAKTNSNYSFARINQKKRNLKFESGIFIVVNIEKRFHLF